MSGSLFLFVIELVDEQIYYMPLLLILILFKR